MPLPTRDGDILTVSGYLLDGLGTVGLKMPNFKFFWSSMSACRLQPPESPSPLLTACR